ncbi:hypothetical protein ACNKHO_15795 [Shigella flexneri]
MHRHSAYILQNSDSPGFKREQQTMMATLVRYHRKAIKLDEFCRALRCSRRASSCRSFSCCAWRVAQSATGDHHAANAEAKKDDYHWTLSFRHDWFSQNALVLLDLEKEQQYWESVTAGRQD